MHIVVILIMVAIIKNIFHKNKQYILLINNNTSVNIQLTN